MTRFFAALLVLIGFSTTTSAAPLSVGEIEQAWASVEQQSGRFTQEYDDGSVQAGQYYAFDPTLIIMTYDAHSAIVVMNGSDTPRDVHLPNGYTVSMTGKQITVIDPGFQTVSNPLSIFERLLSLQPDLSGLVAGSGDTAAVTVIRLRHPQARQRGYVDLTFHNQTHRLVKWVSEIDGERVTTVFQ